MLIAKLRGAAMYIVYLEAPDGEIEHPFKAFDSRAKANAFAQSQVADNADAAEIYEVSGVDDVRKAIAAVKMSEGTLIDKKTRRASQADTENEWRRALAGNDRAFQKFLTD